MSRHERLRAEVSGRWLTPSRKRVIDYALPVPDRIATIWGTLGAASVEATLPWFEWDLATENQQAFSTDSPVAGTGGNAANFRRRWSAETALRRVWPHAVTSELRYVYQERDNRHAPPFGPSAFGAVDRLVQGELSWAAKPTLTARAGGMYDRLTIGEFGPYHPHSYGTRNESRAYLGLDIRFGRVLVGGVEGIELDPEPYPVSFHHDKGFLSLQTRF